ncbi:phage tail sheath family protein [Maricaulis sp.]|uniref:phage tail sheath family protein n=1 Tax=Maricaulis sp. TaxID=1486257 RepID=UPI003A8D139B
MNRRELLLSAGAGTLLLATPQAGAMIQRRPRPRGPGVYVQELPTASPIAGLPTSTALFIGAFSSTLGTGAIGRCSNTNAPAGFDRAQGPVDDFFAQGGSDLVLVQAGADKDGVPDHAAALAGLARDGVPDFNLLLLVGAAEHLAGDPARLSRLYAGGARLARQHFAQLLVEAPDNAPDYAVWRSLLGLNDPDIAAWAPWLTDANGVLTPPGAAIAGLIARTDAAEGVWQAPAGLNATLNGFTARDLPTSRLEAMNQANINAIRPLQGAATVWGARTLSDNTEWRYLPVRRLVRWTEASLTAATANYLFETSNQALWETIERDVTDFLTGLWREGALSGATPREGFWVRCGLGQTMTATDIQTNTVRVQVGLAVLRPAEFIVFDLEFQTAS